MKRILALVLTLVLVLAVAVPVLAHDAPDLTRTGSVTVSVNIPGNRNKGTLTLYRVGSVAEDDGSFYFVPVPELAEGNFDLSDLYAEDLAKNMKTYLDTLEVPLTGLTQAFARRDDGVVSATFSGLELGLYLAVQESRASGYQRLQPFLISVPYYADGVYQYDVDASAKPELERDPDPTNPTRPTDPDLPQTGQLSWPIPVLAVLGLGLFVIGWVLAVGKRRSDET